MNKTLWQRIKIAWRIVLNKQPVPKIHSFTFISHIKLKNSRWRFYSSTLTFDWSNDWYMEQMFMPYSHRSKTQYVAGSIADLKVLDNGEVHTKVK